VRYAIEIGITEQRLMEQRVLFRALLTGAPGLLALKNQDLCYEAVNPAFCQFVGKGPDEIISHADGELFSKTDTKALAKADRKVMRSGASHTEVQEVDAPGGKRWLDIARSPIADANGETTGLLWTAKDITELKQTEDAVRADQAYYHTLAEDQEELACQFGADLALTFANEPMCRFLDRKREELLGQSFLSALPDEEQEAMEKHLAALTVGSPVAAHELGAVSARGDICWQQWTTRALFSDKGDVLGFQAVGRDLTALKRAQDALAEHEQRIAELEEQAAAAAEQLDAKQRLLDEKGAEFEGQAAQSAERIAQSEKLSKQLQAQVEQQAAEVERRVEEAGQHFGQEREQLEQTAAEAEQSVAKSEQQLDETRQQLDETRQKLEQQAETAQQQIAQRDQIVNEKQARLEALEADAGEAERLRRDGLATAAQMAGAATTAASLAQNVTEFMAEALQAMAESDGAESGAEPAKLQELRDVLDKVRALLQKMRPKSA